MLVMCYSTVMPLLMVSPAPPLSLSAKFGRAVEQDRADSAA